VNGVKSQNIEFERLKNCSDPLFPKSRLDPNVVEKLKEYFYVNPNPSKHERIKLAESLNISPEKIYSWFWRASTRMNVSNVGPAKNDEFNLETTEDNIGDIEAFDTAEENCLPESP